MTHDPSYVATLTSEEQIKQDFVTGKGNADSRFLDTHAEIRINSVSDGAILRERYLKLKSETLGQGMYI